MNRVSLKTSKTKYVDTTYLEYKLSLTSSPSSLVFFLSKGERWNVNGTQKFKTPTLYPITRLEWNEDSLSLLYTIDYNVSFMSQSTIMIVG